MMIEITFAQSMEYFYFLLPGLQNRIIMKNWKVIFNKKHGNIGFGSTMVEF